MNLNVPTSKLTMLHVTNKIQWIKNWNLKWLDFFNSSTKQNTFGTLHIGVAEAKKEYLATEEKETIPDKNR